MNSEMSLDDCRSAVTLGQQVNHNNVNILVEFILIKFSVTCADLIRSNWIILTKLCKITVE